MNAPSPLHERRIRTLTHPAFLAGLQRAVTRHHWRLGGLDARHWATLRRIPAVIAGRDHLTDAEVSLVGDIAVLLGFTDADLVGDSDG